MNQYLVCLLILKIMLDELAMLPQGVDSNVSKLLANLSMITKLLAKNSSSSNYMQYQHGICFRQEQ